MAVVSTLSFGLAPMEGVSDLPFRLWLSLTSDPEFTCTPFLRVTNTYPARIPLDFAPELDQLQGMVRYKLVPQLMAASSEDFVRVAKPLLNQSPYVELNCGCPAPNAVGSGAGSSLLRQADKFQAFLQNSTDNLGSEQVAVKMRLGFESSDEFHKLLAVVADLPLRQLTIHARTRKDRYSSYARWDMIRAASEQLQIPVIGSGDILSWSSVRERQQNLQAVHTILVGRGALRNPWIFLLLRRQEDQLILPASILPDSLLCYGLLVELFRYRLPDLLELVGSGRFLEPCLNDADKWSDLLEQLMLLRFGSTNPIQLEQLERNILGRVKLIWNYFRSSLPLDFFSPQLLRVTRMSDFFSQMRQLCEQHGQVLVSHRPAYDWIYTSDKKAPGSYQEFEAQLHKPLDEPLSLLGSRENLLI